jgi:hypothetical protein
MLVIGALATVWFAWQVGWPGGTAEAGAALGGHDVAVASGCWALKPLPLQVDRPHERTQLLAGQLAAGELHERCGGLVAGNPRSAAVRAFRPSALGEASSRPACRSQAATSEELKPGVVIAHAGIGLNPIVK